jgi:cytochrome c-type biogenesis protein CcmH
MRRNIRWFLLLLPLLLLLSGTAGHARVALAQEEITDDEVNEVAKELYCPVCESTPLDVCPTKACADWRELIRTQLSEGASRQDVLDYFARQYGDGVLANPPRRGMSLIILWILPVLAILLGLILFAWLLRGLRKSAPEAAVAGVPGTPAVETTTKATTAAPKPPTTPKTGTDLDDYISRVEQEVKK